MTPFAIGALIGCLIWTCFVIGSTKGRTIELFEWIMLLMAVASGAIFVGGAIQVITRLVSN
jgi:hypothetical protein